MGDREQMRQRLAAFLCHLFEAAKVHGSDPDLCPTEADALKHARSDEWLDNYAIGHSSLYDGNQPEHDWPLWERQADAVLALIGKFNNMEPSFSGRTSSDQRHAGSTPAGSTEAPAAPSSPARAGGGSASPFPSTAVAGGLRESAPGGGNGASARGSLPGISREVSLTFVGMTLMLCELLGVSADAVRATALSRAEAWLDGGDLG